MDRLFEEARWMRSPMPVQRRESSGNGADNIVQAGRRGEVDQLVFTETTTWEYAPRRSTSDSGRRWENVSNVMGRCADQDREHERTVTNYAPEYEDCRRIAAEHHVPLKAVMQEATRAYTNASGATWE